MKISVQYSTLIVKSLEESIHFYRDVLGFREGYHVDLPVGQITIMESLDGACVELIESPNFEVGMYSIGTDVDDLDEAILHLRENGYETIGPVMPTSVGRQTFVADPNGVRICLIEHTEEYKNQDERTRDLAPDFGLRSRHIPYKIRAHPRGAFISVGECTPTETNLL